MSENNDMLGFDEDKAVDFIRATLPAGVSARWSDDEILYVIDVIWDWYEKNGYTSINAGVDEEEEMDIKSLTAFVTKELKRAKEEVMDPADIDLIVKGELQYEESIDPFA